MNAELREMFVNPLARAGTRRRGLRRASRRGVSPIIATILLVAITVVLAAVLYVLISGLTHTGVASPYSVSYGSATPNSYTSGTTTTYWQSVPIFVTAGLTTGQLGFQLKTSSGSVVTLGTAPAACKQGATLAAISASPCATASTTDGPYVVIENATGLIGNVWVYSTNSVGGVWGGNTITLPASGTTAIVVTSANILGTGDYLSAYAITSSASVSGQSAGF